MSSNQAHLPNAHGAQQREYLVDSGNQHHHTSALGASGVLQVLVWKVWEVWRVGCQHTKVAVPVGAWRGYQGGNAVGRCVVGAVERVNRLMGEISSASGGQPAQPGPWAGAVGGGVSGG